MFTPLFPSFFFLSAVSALPEDLSPLLCAAIWALCSACLKGTVLPLSLLAYGPLNKAKQQLSARSKKLPWSRVEKLLAGTLTGPATFLPSGVAGHRPAPPYWGRTAKGDGSRE